MKRAALYVRVSTAEQKKHGLSVDSQIIALKTYCKENGYICAGIYNDAGISARKRYTRRPALLQLMDDCENGKIDIILFTKLDRWFRSVGDYYEVQNVLDRCKVPWKAIWEDYETVTSSGMFKVNIMLSVAQSEADRTSERIKSTIAYKKARGDYLGSAPTGYKVVGRDLVVDENVKVAMHKMFEGYFRNYSLTEAMKAAKEYGLSFDRSHLLKLIKNPAYYGKAAGGYECYAYITKKEHDAIIEQCKKRTRAPKTFGRVFLFSGLCKCGYCGKSMVAKGVCRTHVDGSVVLYKKYICQYSNVTRNVCPPFQITENALESFLLNEFDRILGEHIVKVNKINNNYDPENFERKKTLEAKLSRIANLYEDGDLTIEEYRNKRDSIKAELQTIIIEPIAVPDPLPAEWREIYFDLDEKHKQSFWKKAIKTITITAETKQSPIVEVR